ncbi:MAG TPA: hypothetical protein VFN45_00335 [Myxococcaceae bacterium]|nr:hypothetical protein [Myxococcaceae bacterium]
MARRGTGVDERAEQKQEPSESLFQRAMKPAHKETQEMLPSLRRLFPAVLLLTASGALAESSLPTPETPVREIVTHVPAQQVAAEQQLRALTQEVESLETAVNQLRAKEAERAVHEAELLGPDNHPLWP